MASSANDSSSSSSSSSDKHRRKRERKEKKEKKRRKEKRKNREKEGKKRKRHKVEQEQRSIITGKKIQRADGAAADAGGDARREALRIAMNEGEDEEYGCIVTAASTASTAKPPTPSIMMELMKL